MSLKFLWAALLIAAIFALFATVPSPASADTTAPYAQSSSCLGSGGFCENSIFGCRYKGEVSLGRKDCGFLKNCCTTPAAKIITPPTFTPIPSPAVLSSCSDAGGVCESSIFGCRISGEVNLGRKDCGTWTNCCKPAAPKSVCGNGICETGAGKENYLNCPADCPKPCKDCHMTATPTATPKVTATPAKTPTPASTSCTSKSDGTYCDYYPCITGIGGGKCPGYCKSGACVSGTPTSVCQAHWVNGHAACGKIGKKCIASTCTAGCDDIPSGPGSCECTATCAGVAPTPAPVPTATPSCSDTDTASPSTTTMAVFNYGVKGTCTDTGPAAVCKSGCTDKCASVGEGVVGGTLNEYYCYANRCYSKSYSCPSTQKCSNGACVPK